MTHEQAERQMAVLLEDIDLAETRLRFIHSEPERLVIKRHISNRKHLVQLLATALEPEKVTA